MFRFSNIFVNLPFVERILVGNRLNTIRNDMSTIIDYLSAKISLCKSRFDLVNQPSSYVEAYLKVKTYRLLINHAKYV